MMIRDDLEARRQELKRQEAILQDAYMALPDGSPEERALEVALQAVMIEFKWLWNEIEDEWQRGQSIALRNKARGLNGSEY